MLKGLTRMTVAGINAPTLIPSNLLDNARKGYPRDLHAPK